MRTRAFPGKQKDSIIRRRRIAERGGGVLDAGDPHPVALGAHAESLGKARVVALVRRVLERVGQQGGYLVQRPVDHDPALREPRPVGPFVVDNLPEWCTNWKWGSETAMRIGSLG